MIDLEFRSQPTRPESRRALPLWRMLAMASFIIRYMGWQAARGFGATGPDGRRLGRRFGKSEPLEGDSQPQDFRLTKDLLRSDIECFATDCWQAHGRHKNP
jgi:hypothetical protein